MKCVRIVGWIEGLRKVSMTTAIQRQTGLGLRDSKACTDRVLDGGMVVLCGVDETSTALLATELEALGATVQFTEQISCSCCRFLTLQEPPGSHEICPICGWEDDPVQAANPDLCGGANVDSLRTARSQAYSRWPESVRLLDGFMK